MFLSGVVMTAAVALIWPGAPTSSDLLWGGFAGAANGTAILLLYVAYSRGSLRSAAPTAAVVMSSVPVAWDVLVSGTSPSPVTWAGIVLGMIAIALTSYEPGEASDDRRSVAIAIAAGVIFGGMLILLGEIGEDAGGQPILIQRLVGFVVAASVTRATGPRIFPDDRSARIMSFVVGLFATGGNSAFRLGASGGWKPGGREHHRLTICSGRCTARCCTTWSHHDLVANARRRGFQPRCRTDHHRLSTTGADNRQRLSARGAERWPNAFHSRGPSWSRTSDLTLIRGAL